MTIKAKIFLGVAALLIAFAVGRYTVPIKVKTITQIVEVEKKTDDKKTKTNEHQKTTITETDRPDGTKEITTVTTNDTQTTQDEKSTDQSKSKETQTTEITRAGSRLNLSALAGTQVSLNSGLSPMLYGGSVNKEVLGPITAGAWGLSNGTFGLSLGLDF